MIKEIRSHKDLNVWKKSIDLVDIIYKVTKSFPKEEIYCLTNQVRRPVISIPSNIAEGSGRNSDRDFRRFLNIALSSAFELETQIILSYDLNYIVEKEYLEISEKIQEIQKMIFREEQKFFL